MYDRHDGEFTGDPTWRPSLFVETVSGYANGEFGPGVYAQRDGQRVKAYLGTFELVGGGGSGSEEDEGGGGVCTPGGVDGHNNTRVAVNNNAKTYNL
jgi:hypothetical protein|eukprot:COSAG06_NODE_13576_length_1243_cov_1.857517_1_plen_97_part_00